MTGARWLAGATVAVAVGCALPRTLTPTEGEASSESRREAACRASSAPLVPQWSPPSTDVAMPYGKPVYSVAFHGGRGVPAALLREQMSTRVGGTLEPAAIADDVRRLYRLEVFEDVRVTADERFGRVLLDVHLEERPIVRAVYTAPPRPGDVLPIELVPGELYEPARVGRLAQKERDRLIGLGHLDATVEVRASRADAAVDLCVVSKPGPRYTISAIVFEGNEAIGDQELAGLVTSPSGQYNRVGAPLQADLLARDILMMKALYYDRGMLEIRVGPPVIERRSGDQLAIVVRFEEGPVYRLGRMEVGTSMPGSPKAYQEVLATLPTGSVFRRGEMQALIEALEAVADRQGAESFTVTPALEMDAPSRVVHVRFEAAPSD